MSNFTKCGTCKSFVWSGDTHKCLPKFWCIRRAEWFGYKDTREINELSEEEYKEINWYSYYYAADSSDAAEKYMEYLCQDGTLDSDTIYVKDEFGNITKHGVEARLVLEFNEIYFEEIDFE